MKMNKIINDPDLMVEEMLEGYLFLHGDRFDEIPGIPKSLRKRKMQPKVTILIGGGAGNEPWCLGYVGDGLADVMVSGNVYAAPPAKLLLDAARAVYHEQGILFIGTNHMGDVLNFELVGELAALEGIKTACVFVNDDVASDREDPSNRRGIAGVALAVKIAGAAAELGLSLEEVAAVTQHALDRLHTVSVTTSPGYMPANGKAMCELPAGTVEYGMGFNGEPGFLQEQLPTADRMVERMLDVIVADCAQRERLAVLVNGFGFMTILEQYIVVKAIKDYGRSRGIDFFHVVRDELFCPQGSGGFSVTVLEVDDRLAPFYWHRADSPLFRWEPQARDGKRAEDIPMKTATIREQQL
ncbi:MAG: dihydroxyacetone kinase subunit DhaK [Eubacteriales bacterium]|nr:dihydroxyacetone kinase subunit DhaK [Eubacteriales bacterium]